MKNVVYNNSDEKKGGDIMAEIGTVKKIACLTPQQQNYYNTLTDKKRKYVDFRAQGYSKKDSYVMAGFKGEKVSQSAYVMEQRDSAMVEIIDVMMAVKRGRQLGEQNSELNKTIDTLAMQKGAEEMMRIIDTADVETAKRIQFYRDVVNGKIKTVRKTIFKDKDGKVKWEKIEETSDVSTRLNARKELDRVLGINQMVDVGELNVGDITINIVDASKKEELEDSRNDVVIDMKDTETIDGEEVLVTETVEESAEKGDKEIAKAEKGE